jgi:trehalose-phosphatase
MTAAAPRWALDSVPDLLAGAGGRSLAVFLDYDGTLAPIVPHYDDAWLPAETRAAVAALVRVVPVAVVSGRDLTDVRARVGVAGVVYAGSHGLEIETPGGVHEVAPEARAALAAAATALRAGLPSAPGILLEPKRYGVAVHWRMADPAVLPAVRRAVDAVLARHQTLRLYEGKKVLELQPDVVWDKGHAVRHLLQAASPGAAMPWAIYVGDDRTDEDAFRALGPDGTGIVVREEARATSASWWPRDPGEVTELLTELLRRITTLHGP